MNIAISNVLRSLFQKVIKQETITRSLQSTASTATAKETFLGMDFDSWPALAWVLVGFVVILLLSVYSFFYVFPARAARHFTGKGFFGGGGGFFGEYPISPEAKRAAEPTTQPHRTLSCLPLCMITEIDKG